MFQGIIDQLHQLSILRDISAESEVNGIDSVHYIFQAGSGPINFGVNLDIDSFLHTIEQKVRSVIPQSNMMKYSGVIYSWSWVWCTNIILEMILKQFSWNQILAIVCRLT